MHFRIDHEMMDVADYMDFFVWWVWYGLTCHIFALDEYDMDHVVVLWLARTLNL